LADTIKGVTRMYVWKDNIKNMYDNPTEIYLDALFSNLEGL